MEGAPVTRFAPSPTGHLHVGGARTALFNWALASSRGRYLLRIEDTDRERSSAEAVAGILEDLAWLGISWAEGPAWEGQGGDPGNVGPFFQAQRLERYAAAGRDLIDRDLAYPAFESPEELDALRRAAQAEKRGFRYRRAADFDRGAALARMQREPHVIRFRMPTEPVVVQDAVLGEVEFAEDHLDDFVILKRDGFPTYHFSVVVDDEAMGVTHVLRGQEHLNNTPRHLSLQRALGYRVPIYAHLPIIFNPDGSKMSKRDKDKAARKGEEPPCIDVEDFRAAGYLSEVLCNYLGLLGWSPGEKDPDGKDLERFDLAYLAEHFSIERIGRGNARFDREKLLAFNQDSIALLGDDEFFARWTEWCARYSPAILERDATWRRRYAEVVRTRCRTLFDASAADGPGGFALVADGDFAYQPKAVAKHLAKGDPSGLALLEDARRQLASVDPFDPEAIESCAKRVAEERGVGMGKVAQPLRVAVTGGAASPPLGDTLAVLGRDAVLCRIDRCLSECGAKTG
jgi:glutamyl-tRNA synthetase